MALIQFVKQDYYPYDAAIKYTELVHAKNPCLLFKLFKSIDYCSFSLSMSCTVCQSQKTFENLEPSFGKHEEDVNNLLIGEITNFSADHAHCYLNTITGSKEQYIKNSLIKSVAKRLNIPEDSVITNGVNLSIVSSSEYEIEVLFASLMTAKFLQFPDAEIAVIEQEYNYLKNKVSFTDYVKSYNKHYNYENNYNYANMSGLDLHSPPWVYHTTESNYSSPHGSKQEIVTVKETITERVVEREITTTLTLPVDKTGRKFRKKKCN